MTNFGCWQADRRQRAQIGNLRSRQLFSLFLDDCLTTMLRQTAKAILILGAIVLALVYMVLCQRNANHVAREERK